MIVWDEHKRLSNLAKHGLDFANALRLLSNPVAVVLPVERNSERRLVKIVADPASGEVFTVIGVDRPGAFRIISFRRASRSERRLYAGAQIGN